MESGVFDAFDHRARRRIDARDQFLHVLARRGRKIGLNSGCFGAEFAVLHGRVEGAPQQRGLVDGHAGRPHEGPRHSGGSDHELEQLAVLNFLIFKK